MKSLDDLKYLKKCIALAKSAVAAGDEAFGSVLVNANSEVLAIARNRVNEKNVLAHPELELAQWSLENLTPEQRQQATMYTSGEHCPMCAAAHGWAGIGSLVYLSSAEQLQQWLVEFNATEAPVHFISVDKIIKNVNLKFVNDTQLIAQIKALYRAAYCESKRKSY